MFFHANMRQLASGTSLPVYWLVSVLLGWLILTTAQGQALTEPMGWPLLQVFNVEQGLPQAFVSGVVADDDGFIWISTLGGIARYDGHQMLAFPHRPDDLTSPATGSIIDMVKADHSIGGSPHIWLLHETAGYERFNVRTGKSQQFPGLMKALRGLLLPKHLYVDRQGNLWGTLYLQGIFHFDVARNRFTRLRQATHGLLSDTINTITQDQQGRILAISPTGISQITTVDEPIRSRHFVRPMKDLREMAIRLERVNAFSQPGGEIMLSTRTHLVFINTQHATTRSVPFAARPTIDQPLLSRGSDGMAYLVAGGTLYRYTDTLGLTPLWHYTPPKGAPSGTSFTDFDCTSLCLDRSGVLWLGANTKGLFRIDLAATRLQAYTYQSTFCVDALQTGLGLSLPAYFHWPFGPEQPTSYIFRTDYDRQGRLWMGLGEEVGYYTPLTHQFIHLPKLGKSARIKQDAYLRGLSIDPNGQVWIVSRIGTPYRYDPLTHQWQAPFGQLSVLANNIFADARALWVTTVMHGLLRFDRATHRYRSIRFTAHRDERSNEQLLDLHQDATHPDWLWISSYEGLIRFNKRTGLYRRFTTAQGLPNNTVYSILPDRQGYLWLSTNRGLCRFHPITHTTLNFGLSDGLPGEEFNRFHQLRLPDGRLAFGGVKGWVLFDPTQCKADTTRPTVALTGLTINNQPVDQYGKQSPLEQPLNDLTTLHLTYDQNYLTVDFAALHYHQPDRVMYRYKLQGYDANWTVSQRPTASYTKLPSGQYTLLVDAANAAGQWSRQSKKLAVVVRPAPWFSPWAYGLYGLLLGLALFGLLRFRARRSRERQELVRRQRQTEELQQLDQAKSRFFANVSHELRTPLTLMLGPLNSVLDRHLLDARDEQLIRLADNSARQLLGLVGELLELTKLDAGKLVLQLQPVRLGELLRDCMAPFDTQANQAGLTQRLELALDGDPVVSLDTGKVRQILQNLLANAYKFTPAGGIITVRASCADNQLQVWVIDSGRGIHPDDLPHVFDRYFQTNQANAALEGGTGIGLALCLELVRLMQGIITVDSTLGEGTTFRVELPIVLLSNLSDKDEVDFPGRPEVDVALPDSLANHENKLVIASEVVSVNETVLIVEDNANLLTYLTTILTPSLRVLSAVNGQAALDMLADLSQLPSLIIADIMMPVMDGFQLLETLKTHPIYRAIPVVMLTARTDMADKLRALRLGVDDYLLKPFEEAELIARVTNLLHNQRERQVLIGAGAVDSNDTETSLAVSADDLAWLERVEQLTNVRLSQFDLTADELADELNMSRRTFYRTMKRLTGLTPAQYLAEARFREARRLVETRQVSSVKQLAYRVGLRHINHFAQHYQQRFGKSPVEYL